MRLPVNELLRKRSQQLGKVMLPGWYKDLRGVPCIVVQNRLVSIIVEEDGAFAVVVETTDVEGKFTEATLWESCNSIEDAVRLASTVVGVLCKQASSSLVDLELKRASDCGIRSMKL